MGTYVYALNTNVRTVSGHLLGVAEFRYKPSFGFGGSEYNDRLHRQTCNRRIKFFDDNPEKMPNFMVLSKMEDGRNVYICPSSCFYDGDEKKVGVLKKVGRSWTIQFDEGFDPNSVQQKSNNNYDD